MKSSHRATWLLWNRPLFTGIRHQFGNNASAFQENRKVYFLEVNGEDPSDPFMKRFAGHAPIVKKVSEALTSAGETTGVVDKVTGQHGLIFNQGAIQWIEDDVVEVSGGYFEAGLSASGNIYSFTKENDKWSVTKNKVDWIS